MDQVFGFRAARRIAAEGDDRSPCSYLRRIRRSLLKPRVLLMVGNNYPGPADAEPGGEARSATGCAEPMLLAKHIALTSNFEKRGQRAGGLSQQET